MSNDQGATTFAPVPLESAIHAMIWDAGVQCPRFVDRSTGRAHVLKDEYNLNADDQALLDAADSDDDRFVWLESIDPGESYAWMESFVESIPVDHIRVRLQESLAGPKPFRRFKDVLYDYSEIQNLYFAYLERRQREAARLKLEAENVDWIEPEDITRDDDLTVLESPLADYDVSEGDEDSTPVVSAPEVNVYHIPRLEASNVKSVAGATVGTLAQSRTLSSRWILLHADSASSEWMKTTHPTVLYVVEGQVRVENRDRPDHVLVLSAGETWFVEAGTEYRLMRYPTGGPRTLLFAVDGA